MKKKAAGDPRDAAAIVEAIRKSPLGKVKVAVSDIDGVLRGKYLHKDKFLAAVEGGFGFCDVVFGWDSGDQCYDNTKLTGWHHGFPDAMVRLDLNTFRTVPWDGGIPFFLGHFVKADGSPLPICPRQVLRRVLARARKMGFTAMVGAEYEFFNFAETPQSWAAKKGVGPEPLTPGMFGYSLLRTNANREYFNALMGMAPMYWPTVNSYKRLVNGIWAPRTCRAPRMLIAAPPATSRPRRAAPRGARRSPAAPRRARGPAPRRGRSSRPPAACACRA